MPRQLLGRRLRWFKAVALLFLFLSFNSVAGGGARLAIIIDDLGYNLDLGQRSASLPGAITLAVLPLTPYGRNIAGLGDKKGKEVMVHLPMSNHHRHPLGPGGLVAGMSKSKFLEVLRQNLASIPYAKGVNNHMGSLLTEQAEPMGWLMQELRARQLYFIDSRTTALTQALNEAERKHVPSRRRDLFLDNSRNPTHIRIQLMRALELARRQGSAVAIGHPYPETLTVLSAIGPLLKRYNVELVPVSSLLAPIPSGNSRGSFCLAPPVHLWPQIWVPVNLFEHSLFIGPEQFSINRSKN